MKPKNAFLILLPAMLLMSCNGGSLYGDSSSDSRWKLGINFGASVPSLIAFSRLYVVNYSQQRDLFVMFPDGTHQKRLTDNPADDDYPAFSPDGFAVAFVSNRSRQGMGNHDVFRYKSLSKAIQLTNDAWEFDSSTTDWGPDYITVAQHNTLAMVPFDLIHIEEISPIGKWEKPVETGNIGSYDPCISHDGTMIAFCARLNCPSEVDPGCNGTLQLFLLRDGETTPVQLTHFGGSPEEPILTRHPAFDFAGSRIVFQTTYWGKDWDIGYIYVNNQDEAEPIRVTDNPSDDMEPCFDPSGQWIAYASNRDGNFEIYKTWDAHAPVDIPIPAQTTVRLTKTAEDESNPDWSPAY